MKCLAFVLIGMLALVVSAPAYALVAGITLDVHQDCDDPLLLPNDFHVEGKICSHFGAPVLTGHVDGPFVPPLGTFSYTITKVVPGDPEDCWYTFTGDWSGATIPYCTMTHFGLVFEVNGANIIINLVGWWTRDGVKIGEVIGGLVNGGYVPGTGFNVSDDSANGQSVRITKGIQRSPQFPPIGGAQPPPLIPIEIVAMDLVSFGPGHQPRIEDLTVGGAQENFQWVHAVDAHGTPISEINPMPWNVDSFFDVFIEVPIAGQAGVDQPFHIPPGGSLVARTKMRFINNKGETELKWQWDIHGEPTSSPCDWNPNDPAKWLQMPDVSPTGIDVRVDSLQGTQRILADDFQCIQTSRITDVHFWGSWLNDQKGVIDRLTISFYSDVPVPAGGTGFSKPGNLLWQNIFVPGQFSEKLYATVPPDSLGVPQYEWFWDPFTGAIQQNGDQQVWQYDICIDPAIAYLQQGTPATPIIYWLAIRAHVIQDAANPRQFGWKTRDPIATHYGGGHSFDDAVQGVQNTNGTISWNDLHYPTGHPYHTYAQNSLDMAFVITSETPPPCCLQASYGAAQPADHMFTCVQGNDPPPNLMQHVKICNPCPTDKLIYGMKLQAGGTGNLSSIGQIQVFLDANCDGFADSAMPILTGNYDMFGIATLCSTTGPVYVLPAAGVAGPSCVCFLIKYRMICPAAPGTYFFDLVNILGPNCQPICTDNLPLRSAVKMIDPIPNPVWKYQQLPDLTANGIDVNATQPLILADDFRCCKQTKITNITVWGSWRDNGYPLDAQGNPGNVTFKLSLHRDIPDPDGTGSKYSKPGSVLWYKTFAPGSFTVTKEKDGDEGWYDPSIPTSYTFPGDWTCWRYDFVIPASDAFCQQGTVANPVVYWLDVQASPPLQTAFKFGWKTSSQHWMDDAVWGSGVEPYAGPWNELRYPWGHPYYQLPPLISPSIDLAFEIGGYETCEKLVDWGDAPDGPYPTRLLPGNGARHDINPNMMLGTAIDAEPDGQPNPTATGDDTAGVPDDEDGVFFNTIYVGNWAKVKVIATMPGKINAWMDFNHLNGWADAGEQIFTNKPVVAGVNWLAYFVPASALPGPTFARFRYNSGGGLTFTGLATDGEVEDYQVQVLPAPIIVTKAQAKLQPIGTAVMLVKNVVTGNFDVNGWYFEEPDRDVGPTIRFGRWAGIGVVVDPQNPAPWVPGDLVSCIGTTMMNGCELMIQEECSWKEDDATPLKPLSQTNRDSGGEVFGNQPAMTNIVGITPDPDAPAFGLNYVASLVTLFGRCTCVEEIGGVQTNFWIDDGSNLWDGNTCGALAPARGVKVRLPSGYTIPPISTQSYYVVTGIMRTDSASGGECVRWLWPRDQADILAYPIP